MEIEVPGPAGVLLVADDPASSSEMAAYLAARGYAVHQAADAADARRILAERSIAVVVLDAGGETGAAVRALGGDAPPVLVLSALGGDTDPVLAASGGRHRQAAKPITGPDLLARLRAMAADGVFP